MCAQIAKKKTIALPHSPNHLVVWLHSRGDFFRFRSIVDFRIRMMAVRNGSPCDVATCVLCGEFASDFTQALNTAYIFMFQELSHSSSRGPKQPHPRAYQEGPLSTSVESWSSRVAPSASPRPPPPFPCPFGSARQAALGEVRRPRAARGVPLARHVRLGRRRRLGLRGRRLLRRLLRLGRLLLLRAQQCTSTGSWRARRTRWLRGLTRTQLPPQVARALPLAVLGGGLPGPARRPGERRPPARACPARACRARAHPPR
jgi:hypothetical protein